MTFHGDYRLDTSNLSHLIFHRYELPGDDIEYADPDGSLPRHWVAH